MSHLLWNGRIDHDSAGDTPCLHQRVQPCDGATRILRRGSHYFRLNFFRFSSGALPDMLLIDTSACRNTPGGAHATASRKYRDRASASKAPCM
ncbi:hypothetical protein ET532_026295 [Verminephrobacter sp. Larva24]|nr:hypothetical protein ET532_026295 [Verminephrobacter sp. Larva24]